MQSTFVRPLGDVAHVAAVMDSHSLERLPALVAACRDLEVEALTVCTLPPDLHLAGAREAAAMVEALVQVLSGLDDVRLSMLGRRYYLPQRLTDLIMKSSSDGLPHVRIALDYACKASILSPPAGTTPARLLLLPEGLEPGNLLRWQYAQAARANVAWQSFDKSMLSDLLDCHAGIGGDQVATIGRLVYRLARSSML